MIFWNSLKPRIDLKLNFNIYLMILPSYQNVYERNWRELNTLEESSLTGSLDNDDTLDFKIMANDERIQYIGIQHIRTQYIRM